MMIALIPSDVANGVRGQPDACAIARAVKRAAGRDDVAVENADEIKIGRRTYSVPDYADTFLVDKFIQRFDCGAPVDLIAFEIVHAFGS